MISRVRRRAINQGYENLQSIYGVGRVTSTENAPIQTKEDVKFKASKQLFLLSTWLKNASTVLEEYCTMFSYKSLSRNQILQKSSHLKKYILPLLVHSSDLIDKFGHVLAPIGGINYVHQRNEVQHMKKVIDTTNPRMSKALQLVYDFVWL